MMIIVLAMIWWPVRSFTTIVVLALLLAYILDPAIQLTARRLRCPRATATLVVYGVLAVVVIAVPILAAPAVAARLREVDVLALSQSVQRDLRLVLPPGLRLAGLQVDLEPLYDELSGYLQGFLAELPGQASLLWFVGLASDFVVSVLGVLVIYVVSLYIAIDTRRIFNWLEGKVPEPYVPVYRTLLREVDLVWRSFFRGQLLLAFVVGLLTTLGLLVLGIPYALTLGLVAGVLEVVPRLGPILSVIPALAVAAVQGSTTLPGLPMPWLLLLVFGLYVLIQNLENNLLVPRILGRSVNLPPAVVLIGALVGAKLAGVAGILLAAPIMGTMRVLGSWILHQVTRSDEWVEEAAAPAALALGAEARPAPGPTPAGEAGTGTGPGTGLAEGEPRQVPRPS
jgi:predicted PurR-regulated permease PerM